MTRVLTLVVLAACTGTSPEAPAPPPTEPAAPPEIPVEPATSTEAPPVSEAGTSGLPPLRPAFVQVHGTFAVDREHTLLRPFTLDGAEVPVALDLAVFDADPGEQTPPACGLSLRPKEPAVAPTWITLQIPGDLPPVVHVGLSLEPGAFDVVDHSSAAAGLPGCLELAKGRGWASEPWGSDPVATLAASPWGIYLGALPDALVPSLPEHGAYRQGIGAAGTLVTPALGHASLSEATARPVDADFAVQTGPGGEPMPLRTIVMVPPAQDVLPVTGAYRIFDRDQVFAAEALLRPETGTEP